MIGGRFRSLALLIVVSMLVVNSLPSASADETDVTVEFGNVGTLDVTWVGGNGTFLDAGTVPGVSSSQTGIATASFTIEIEDTRADGARPGYSISLRAGPIENLEAGTTIDAAHLTIMSLDVSPEIANQTNIVGSSLAAPVPLLSVGDETNPVSSSIELVVQLTIPAGTRPGNYAGQLALDVTFVTT